MQAAGLPRAVIPAAPRGPRSVPHHRLPCQECSVEPAADSDLQIELKDDDELLVYCAECWEREFGEDAYHPRSARSLSPAAETTMRPIASFYRLLKTARGSQRGSPGPVSVSCPSRLGNARLMPMREWRTVWDRLG